MSPVEQLYCPAYSSVVAFMVSTSVAETEAPHLEQSSWGLRAPGRVDSICDLTAVRTALGHRRRRRGARGQGAGDALG